MTELMALLIKHSSVIAAILAPLLSILTLAVLVWFGSSTHKHQRATLRPYLIDQLGIHDYGKQYVFSITNSGNGLALISNIRVLYAGKVYHDLFFVFKKFLDDNSAEKDIILVTRSQKTLVIPVGENVITLKAECNNKQAAGQLSDFFGHIDVEIAYKDLFDKTYHFKLDKKNKQS